ncbi:MAG: amidohydrolase family protein [Pyrinomonadaceae bacterium]
MQHFIAFSLFFVFAWTAFCQGPDSRIAGATDGHVHILSPHLIKVWKDQGIPFSRPDEYYSNIDTILNNSGTKRIDLVSMAHVYSSEEFGRTENDREMVEKENAFVAAARDKHPKRIRAFCSVDPLRDYALEELERCRTKLKMDGIKLHNNANQVYLTVPEHLGKVKSVFEFAARHKLPILLHFDNSHRRFGKPDVDLLVDSILKGLPPVRLRIAHFGTSGGFSQRTRGFLNAFIDKFDTEPELKKHRITFDISAVALDKDSEGVNRLTDEEFAVLRRYIQRLGPERIAFGTDYPLYTAAEYVEILRTRVGLTDSELRLILKEK